MKSTIARGLLAVVGLFGVGCSAEVERAESVAETQDAVVGVDTFLYFRSNASGWGADSTTRLLPFVQSGLFARAVNVNQSWMVNPGGDSAIVTETNQLDGWGSVSTHFTTSGGAVVEPATQSLTPGSANFSVRYGALGTHRALVNTNVSPWTLTIEPVTCPVCPSPTRCVVNANSTPTCAL